MTCPMCGFPVDTNEHYCPVRPFRDDEMRAAQFDPRMSLSYWLENHAGVHQRRTAKRLAAVR